MALMHCTLNSSSRSVTTLRFRRSTPRTSNRIDSFGETVRSWSS